MNCRRFCSIVAVGVVTAVASHSLGDVLNFEDLIGQAPVPNGYGGVDDWAGWTYYDFEQFPYTAHSPPCRIYNTASGNIGFGHEVVFEGAWFAGHGSSRGFSPISFQLYHNGNLVHTSGSIDLQSDGVPTWLDSGYTDVVDRVVVSGSQGFYVMDDVTFHEAGGYRLSLGGDCPGQVTVSWSGATPSRQQGIVFGANQGNTTIPNGVCQGTVLGVSGQVRLVNTIGTGNGSGMISGNAGTASCGHFLQLVEAPSCNVSNVGQIPN